MTSTLLPALPSSYVSLPVIPFAPNAPDGRAHAWNWPGQSDTSPAGLAGFSVNALFSAEAITLNYAGLTRADVLTLEAFVDSQAGRWAGFWCPSFQLDFVAEDFVSGHPTGEFAVREYGQAAFIPGVTLIYVAGQTWNHVAAYRAGVWYLNRWGVDPSGDTTTDGAGNLLRGYGFAIGGPEAGSSSVVTVGSPTFATGLRLMRLLWSRFADDAIQVSWTHPNLANVTLKIQTVPADTP